MIDDFEGSASKYNSSRENLKERLFEVANKTDKLGKTLTEEEKKKYFEMSIECFKKHQKLMDSLASETPIKKKSNNN